MKNLWIMLAVLLLVECSAVTSAGIREIEDLQLQSVSILFYFYIIYCKKKFKLFKTFCHLTLSRSGKKELTVQLLYGKISKIGPPYWIRHFEFFKSEIKFGFNDFKNLRILKHS